MDLFCSKWKNCCLQAQKQIGRRLGQTEQTFNQETKCKKGEKKRKCTQGKEMSRGKKKIQANCEKMC
jgi:hypothetical protein